MEFITDDGLAYLTTTVMAVLLWLALLVLAHWLGREEA
jgi:hypothetical protein